MITFLKILEAASQSMQIADTDQPASTSTSATQPSATQPSPTVHIDVNKDNITVEHALKDLQELQREFQKVQSVLVSICMIKKK